MGRHAADRRPEPGHLIRFLIKGGLPFVLLLLAPAVLPAVFPSVPRSYNALDGGLPAYGVDLAIWASGIALGVVILLLILPLCRALFQNLLPGAHSP